MIGKVFKTRSFGEVEVVEYSGAKKVRVRFVETGYETTTTTDNIINGRVKDKMKPTVHGFGFIGEGKYNSSSIYYTKWHGMISRCYGDKEINKTYNDCSICDEWRNFQVFAEWCEGKYKQGLELDKDYLSKGVKIYSPSTCSFITTEKNRANKGDQVNNTSGYKGVNFEKSSRKWLARVSVGNGKRVRVGLFDTPELANKERIKFLNKL